MTYEEAVAQRTNLEEQLYALLKSRGLNEYELHLVVTLVNAIQTYSNVAAIDRHEQEETHN